MAKKRRKKRVTALSSRRRKSSPMKRRVTRRRGLSAKNIPIIGELSLKNPLIGGAVGGWGASLLKDEIQDTFFGEPKDPADDSDLLVKVQPYAKGLVLGTLAYFAARMGHREVAAGVVGAAAAYTRDKLQSEGEKAGGRVGVSQGGSNMRRITQFSGETMLSSGNMLSEQRMLSSRRGR